MQVYCWPVMFFLRCCSIHSLSSVCTERGCILNYKISSQVIKRIPTLLKKIPNSHLPEKVSVPLEIIKVADLKIVTFFSSICAIVSILNYCKNKDAKGIINLVILLLLRKYS